MKFDLNKKYIVILGFASKYYLFIASLFQQLVQTGRGGSLVQMNASPASLDIICFLQCYTTQHRVCFVPAGGSSQFLDKTIAFSVYMRPDFLNHLLIERSVNVSHKQKYRYIDTFSCIPFD